MALLSIGLIGVAAAVYVGVGQTRSSLDDSAAAAVARQAAATLAQMMTRDNTSEWADSKYHAFPESNTPTPGALQLATAGSQICASDPRYAWIPVYRRETDSPIAQLMIFVVRSEARPNFDANDLTTFEGLYPATLLPAPATTYSVTIHGNEIELNMPNGLERIAPGALILLNGGDAVVNGRVVRISARGEGNRWELTPGQDLADAIDTHAREVAANPEGADPTFHPSVESAFIIGRGYADVTKPSLGYNGPNQAVAVYSTIVTLR